jgi:hypothetical protein
LASDRGRGARWRMSRGSTGLLAIPVMSDPKSRKHSGERFSFQRYFGD